MNHNPLSVDRGIPGGPTDIYFNVHDEVGYNFANVEQTLLSEMIPYMDHYINRGISMLIVPGDKRVIFKGELSAEYLSYLQALKGEEIHREDIIPFGDKDKMLTQLKCRNGETRRFLSFVSLKTGLELAKLLQNNFPGKIVSDNDNGHHIDKANSKLFLSKNYRKKYMIGGIELFLENDWQSELRHTYGGYQKKGLNMILRLDRSVSGLGIKYIKNKKDLDDAIVLLEQLSKILPSGFHGVLCEYLIPESSILNSPSCQGYMDKSGNIDVFGSTNQILNEAKSHEGNILIDEQDPISQKMVEISQDIMSYYYKALGVKGYFGIDFVLLDASTIDIKQYEISDLTALEIDGRPYFLLVVEVNFRMTGAYSSCLLKNLYSTDLENVNIANFNTIPITLKKGETYEQTQSRIILTLNQSNLLFHPNSQSSIKTVFPYAITPGKLQTVITGHSLEEVEKIHKQILQLFS